MMARFGGGRYALPGLAALGYASEPDCGRPLERGTYIMLRGEDALDRERVYG